MMERHVSAFPQLLICIKPFPESFPVFCYFVFSCYYRYLNKRRCIPKLMPSIVFSVTRAPYCCVVVLPCSRVLPVLMSCRYMPDLVSLRVVGRLSKGAHRSKLYHILQQEGPQHVYQAGVMAGGAKGNTEQ